MSDLNVTQHLAQMLKPFGPVSGIALSELARVGCQVQHHRDDSILPGDYVVLEGVVARQVETTDGETRITHVFEHGDAMGVAASNTNTMAEHRALNECHLIMVNTKDWTATLSAHPDLALAILALKERQMERLVRRIASLMGESVRTRLARYILRHFDHGRSGSYSTRLPLRQYDLARYFGVQPETINRQFRALCEQGAIGIDGQTVELRDPALLTRAAMNQG